MPDQPIRIIFPTRDVEFDIALDPADPSELMMIQQMSAGRCYEPEVAHVMLRVVEEGDFCIDVGAHVGFFTLLLSKLVGTGSVLAFEPATGNLSRMKDNLVRNGVNNVRLIEHPAWNKPEKLRFYLNADSSGGHALWDPGLWATNERSRKLRKSYEIDAVTIDDCVHHETKLIKIDTEGAEQRILEGAHLLMLMEPPFIIAELAPFGLEKLGCSPQALRKLMQSHGYETFLIHGNGDLPSLVPRTTEIEYMLGMAVMNIMFSTLENVSKYWSKVP